MACSACYTGIIHTGTPVGREETIHDLSTYVTGPDLKEAKGLIVIIPDAFGWTLPNNRILADNFAKRTGCIVYLPDFMDGHIVAASALDGMDWLVNSSWLAKPFAVANLMVTFATNMPTFLWFNRIAVARPRITNFFKAVRGSEGTTLKIGAAGYCYGGLHVTLLSADEEKVDGKSLIDAGFTAHPSFLTIPKDIEAIKLPYSVAVGHDDMAIGEKYVTQMDDILKAKEKQEEGKGRFESVVIKGAKHGFAVRNNPKDQKQAKMGMQAEDQAVRWFEKWVVG